MSLLAQVVYAARKPPAPAAVKARSAAAKALENLLKKPFTFGAENRSDPFKPFISDQMLKAQAEAEANAEAVSLTGMQLFEPGQLDLVAILSSGKQSLAMVQDSAGKGYIIRKGTKIGRRGQVIAIMPNAVLIKEWFLGSGGKKLYKDNEMVLRKEGGNK
jgi:type IV pilus assembly protein PilP